MTRGDRANHLTGIEFKVLYELVLHEGQVLTHQILTDRVWGYDAVEDGSLLKGHIHNLRTKPRQHILDLRGALRLALAMLLLPVAGGDGADDRAVRSARHGQPQT